MLPKKGDKHKSPKKGGAKGGKSQKAGDSESYQL